jgi:glycosyltransferase involved in cell wall biosynthesis
LLGLWTERLTHCATGFADLKVVSPVPYAPPLPARGNLAYFSAFRRAERHRWDGPVEVFHPRLLIGPGFTTRSLEAASYLVAIAPLVQRLRRSFDFDLIHAHFSYPDGVAACALGRRYGVPVVVTEHVPWIPWMTQLPHVFRQAAWAVRAADAVVPVSQHVSGTVLEALGDGVNLAEPIPLVVDGDVFRPGPQPRRRSSQLLFVGAVRRVKGVDVLIEALALLRHERPDVRLVIAGDGFYRSYRREADLMLARAQALGLGDAIDVVGGRPPAEIAALMRQSAALVVPGREESFSAVTIEALACGTPVVATRCGGPEELLTPALGRLVPREDPAALAAALADVLDEPERYPAQRLRSTALERYGADAVASRLAQRYAAVIEGRRSRLASPLVALREETGKA